VLLMLVSLAAQAQAGVMLQYFESRWETIEKKVPDAYVTGYSAFWFPPPGKADSGGYSVGYDVYDRFNLGSAFDQTLYGTESGVRQLTRSAHRAGMNVYFDFISNHNGYRNAGTPGFNEAGGYPGFVLTLPEDVDGDFHGAYAGGDWEERLAGLMDIAQEKNHVFIRHPVTAGAQNIPNQLPNPLNAMLYPDLALPANSVGIHPFNTADPMAGDPVAENATGLLLRNAQWMLDSIGCDGFRLDAVKHVPPWFYTTYFDPVMYQRDGTDAAGNPKTAFSFGEDLTGDVGQIAQYARKDGFGNRDVLDFPLFFAIQNVFNGGGYGDMRSLENASVDSLDGNANDGTYGVTFVSSHDNGPPALDNVAYAFVLTRPGFPIVYFNAKEFGNDRSFPQNGRGDALGGDFGDYVPRLVDIARRYAKGTYQTRSIDGDVYVYERSNSLIVGLSDRGDSGYDTRTIQTDFRDVTLTELSGAASDPVVNANGDIFSTISVGSDGMATLRVPRNKTNATTHNKGVVMYGLATPGQTQTLSPVAAVLGPDPITVPNGSRRMTPLNVVTSDSLTVTVQTSSAIAEDNALIKLDGGVAVDSNAGLFITSGEFAGFEEFTGTHSPRASSGTGTYSLAIDTSGLSEGMHYLDTVAFTPRSSGLPAAYSSKRSVIYLDRTPPPVTLAFPSTTGTSDVLSQSYGVVAKCPDFTADAMHIFFDEPVGYDFAGNVNSSNQMSRTDRNEFHYNWNSISPGTHSITIVAFEPTGNSSVTRFDNIGAVIPQPNMELGIDNNDTAGTDDFQPVPSTISSAAYSHDFVVRVDTSGGISYPADYDVFLDVDGATYAAQAYNSSLLPPVGRLVQNDQNLGDQFDEFRFVWRGYGRGNHTMRARAVLKSGSSPENSQASIINVPESVVGPTVFITSPANGASFDMPTSLSVTINTSSLAESVIAYVDDGSGRQLIGLSNSPGTQVSFSADAGSYGSSDLLQGLNLHNGSYSITAQAASGQDGNGIVTEASIGFTVTGYAATGETTSPVINGDISEFFNREPLAVSAADGAGASPAVADFGADGSLTELHARIANNNLYVAVRGDLFNGTDPNMNATILYIDTDATSGTGATQMGSTSGLSDTADHLRQTATNSGFSLSPALQSQGIGFDAAVVVDGSNPLSAKAYGFGSGGVAGSAGNFSELQANIAFGRALESYPGASGTSIAGPSGFEVAIPLSQLGNANPRDLRFVAVTTSDGSFPSPNTLPENSQNTFDSAQVLDAVAQFPQQPGLHLNEISNGATDWAEIYNPGAASANLDLWSLLWTDANGAAGSEALDGMILPAGGYGVLRDGTLAPAPAIGKVSSTNITWDPARAGSAALIDPYGIAVDYVRWQSSTNGQFSNTVPAGTAFNDWSTGFDAVNVASSLSRDTASTDSDAAADWQARYPTPGAVNSDVAAGVKDWSLY
jgi:glycosidase